jgi:hypothetical protein
MKFKCIAVSVFLVLILSACEHALGPLPERQFSFYTVYINDFEHGTVKVDPVTAKAGASISVEVNPDPGWILSGDGGVIGDGNLGLSFAANHFDMPSSNVFLTVTLQPVPSGNFTITRGPVSHGSITPDVMYGLPGTTVTVSVVPKEGYALKTGGLQANGVVVAGPPYTFTIGSQHITLTAEFEPLSDPLMLLARGKAALEAGDYDAAKVLFETAYNRDLNSNDEIIFWAALSKLAGLLIDTDVRANVFRSHLGISGYPGTLNLLFSNTWLTEYYYGETTDFMYLPRLSLPDGWGNDSIHQDSLRGDSKNSMLTWRRDIWAVLVRRNARGFNEFLDDTLDFLFGEKFESIAALAGTMGNTRIPVNSNIIKSLHLEDILNDGDTLGKVELDLAFSVFRTAKAAAEYLAAYDWSIDTSIFPMDLLVEFNNILDEILDWTNTKATSGGSDVNAVEAVLPFRAQVTKVRQAEMLVKARRDFTTAINCFEKAGDHYFGPGQIPQSILDVRGDYPWIPASLRALKTTLADSGGRFYFSGDLGAAVKDFIKHWYEFGVVFNLPKGNYTGSGTARYTLDVDKLFIPGQFSLGNLFATVNGDTPRFYGFNGTDIQNGVLITTTSQISGFSRVGFKLNMNAIKEVFPQGFTQYGDEEWLHTFFPEVILNRDPYRNSERIYNYYYRH